MIPIHVSQSVFALNIWPSAVKSVNLVGEVWKRKHMWNCAQNIYMMRDQVNERKKKFFFKRRKNLRSGVKWWGETFFCWKPPPFKSDKPIHILISFRFVRWRSYRLCACVGNVMKRSLFLLSFALQRIMITQRFFPFRFFSRAVSFLWCGLSQQK